MPRVLLPEHPLWLAVSHEHPEVVFVGAPRRLRAIHEHRASSLRVSRGACQQVGDARGVFVLSGPVPTVSAVELDGFWRNDEASQAGVKERTVATLSGECHLLTTDD